jgi:Outer membrane lipoprotein-sorting protein
VRAGGLWRRFPALAAAILVAGILTRPAGAQTGRDSPPPEFAQFGKPDQQQGREILEQFRGQGLTGDYFLEFELRVLPRRGDERVLHGRLWGSRNAAGPVSRVALDPTALGGAGVRLLVQNGPAPALWQWTGVAAEPLGVGAEFAPLAGTDLTPFDLQMPFLYWPDFVYEGLVRSHGRPAHRFLLYPPKDLAAHHPELSAVRVDLDTQYVALVEAELLGPGGRPLKTVSLLDLQKVGEQWLVKAIDLRDDTTRNKTRFAVTAAALNLHLPPAIFTPGGLGGPAPVPADLVRLGGS